MKKILFIFVIFLLGVISLALKNSSSQINSASENLVDNDKEYVKTEFFEKAPQKLASQEIVQTQKSAFQVLKIMREVNSGDKPIFLEKKLYKPKVEKEVLEIEFAKHLSIFTKNCDLDFKKRKAELEKKIEDLIQFLTESLKDPYMNYKMALLFRDILSIMEEDLKTSSDFIMAYKLLYNISEKVQPEDFQHEWAKSIYKSIKCSEVLLSSIIKGYM